MQFSNSSILPDTEKYIFVPFPRFAVQSIAIALVSLRVQKSPLVGSFVQKNPQGLQRVHYVFSCARLDLQFLTICVHIGYICKKIRLGATVVG